MMSEEYAKKDGGWCEETNQRYRAQHEITLASVDLSSEALLRPRVIPADEVLPTYDDVITINGETEGDRNRLTDAMLINFMKAKGRAEAVLGLGFLLPSSSFASRLHSRFVLSSGNLRASKNI